MGPIPDCERCGLPVMADFARQGRFCTCDWELEPVALSGGKRTNIRPGNLDDFWVGYGKDEGCQFEGPWEHLAEIAARILAHPNTQKAAPHLYRPDLAPDGLDTDALVTVCNNCLQASCWQGAFLCDGSGGAGTVDLPVRALRAMDREHPEWWDIDPETGCARHLGKIRDGGDR